jgi:hypothetical protein
MSAVSQKAGTIWTEAELQSMPDYGYVREVVNGELWSRWVPFREVDFVRRCGNVPPFKIL